MGSKGDHLLFTHQVYKTGRCFVQTLLGDSQWNHLKKTFTYQKSVAPHSSVGGLGWGYRWSNPPSSQSPTPSVRCLPKDCCSLPMKHWWVKRCRYPYFMVYDDPVALFLKTYLLTLNKENQLNVGKYTIHGSYGSSRVRQLVTAKTTCLPCQLKMSESDAVPRPSGKPTTGETEPEWKSWRFFVTLQGINISPEKWWLEDVFPIEIVPFWGTC